MVSFLRKAARMNLVAMDFVLQVTVVELVLGALDEGTTLSFELSRGTKTSGLPPKEVFSTRSEWGQTMQVVITLFLDKRSGRFQDKEYKLRLVQAEKGRAIIMAPALATFTLDASLYAHLGAGPSVEQTVDLYAPKLNGPGGDATVYLRVRCCEPTGKGGGSGVGRSVSAPNVMSSAASLQMGLPQRAAPSNAGQMGLPLPPPDPSDPSLLVGSSFGFSMSGSESRYSVMSGSTGSSAYSTPIRRRTGRPWSNEDLDRLSSTRSRFRSSTRSKLGSKSFNDLDDSGHRSVASSKRSGGAAAPSHHRTLRSSFSSFGGLLGSMGGSSSGVGGQSPGHQLALSGRRAAAAAAAAAAAEGAAVSPGTGVLTSESSSSASSLVAADTTTRRRSPGGGGTDIGRVRDGPGRGGDSSGNGRLGSAAAASAAGVPYDRTTTVGYYRLLARFTKGPSPRGRRPRRPPPMADRFAESAAASRELGSGSSTSYAGSVNSFAAACGPGGSGSAGNTGNGGKFDLPGKRRMLTFSNKSTRASAAAAASPRALGDDAGGHGGGGGGGGGGGERSGSLNATAPPSAFSSPPGAPKQHPPLQAPPMPALPSVAGTNPLQPPFAAGAAPAPATAEQRGSGGGGAASAAGRARQAGGSGPITAAASSGHKPPSMSILSLSSLSLSSSTTARGGGSAGGSAGGGGWSVMSRTPQVGPAGGDTSRGGGGGGDGDGGEGQGSRGAAAAPGASAAAAAAAAEVQTAEDSADGGVGGSGGSAVAAPPSLNDAGGGAGGGGGGGMRPSSLLPPPKPSALSEDSGMAGVEAADKVVHLEAALLRSEVELGRFNSELTATRQELHDLRAEKDAAADLPTSGDIQALYHALEGSVVLLQIASEKMLRLEQAIAKHRGILPLDVYQELQDCVSQDASQLSPIPGPHKLQPQQVFQPHQAH